MNSIRRRLLVGLLAGVTAAVLLSAISTYRVARDEANALFDYQLQQAALSLREGVLADALLSPPIDEDDEALQMVVQIWDRSGTRLYLSRPQARMPLHAQPGFTDVETDQGRWRVFTAIAADHLVQVAQPHSVRDNLAADLAWRTIWPLAAVLPLLGLLIWLTVGRGLAPLARLAGDLSRRSPAALEPVPAERLPEELRPLVASLNDLLQRLGQSLESQRVFVADAAHELRTPLTALSLQAQLAQRAGTTEERGTALGQLRLGIERATHLVEQLLILARTEGQSAARALPGRVALDELAREAAAELANLSGAKGVDLGLERVEAVAVTGERASLRTMLLNLLDNAVKYTPRGGRVDVSVRAEGGDALIEVRDTGPGIAPDERERVFDRFYRVAGSAQTGSGLGLAIARRVAAAHDGAIELGDAAPHGLCVTVRLPLAKPA
ncbi:MAG TPA: ATP-binding protein [Burkholderiales bacterium]|nr:ATP-binding protein [Burkholderiales bacterium]